MGQKILVVGQGSIGVRHARILSEMGAQISVVSQRGSAQYPCFSSLEDACTDMIFDKVVIASSTVDHARDLNRLAQLGFAGAVLVEKPAVMRALEGKSAYPFSLHVAYQLRFHPLTQALRQLLVDDVIFTAHGYVGQHLSQWRPQRELHDTYSAHKASGGGVMRDLSHELDLAQYWFGAIAESKAMIVRASEVTHDSEDAAGFLLRCHHCPLVTLQMNYLDPMCRRQWFLVTKKHSVTVDFIQGSLEVDGNISVLPHEPDTPYRAMHEAWLSGSLELCDVKQGLALVRVMDAAEEPL